MDKNPYKARINTREFLNLPGFHDGAYVVVYVEDTTNRKLNNNDYGIYNVEPRLILEIADCYTQKRVNLELEIDTALNRQNSFHKIDTLIAALEEMKAGLSEECKLYRAREEELKALKAEAEKKKKK